MRWAWIVLDGELLIDSDARVETVVAGEQWGTAQVLNQDRRSYEIAARTDAVVIALPERHLLGLLGTEIPFANWITRQLAGDVSELQAELALVGSLAPAV